MWIWVLIFFLYPTSNRSLNLFCARWCFMTFLETNHEPFFPKSAVLFSNLISKSEFNWKSYLRNTIFGYLLYQDIRKRNLKYPVFRPLMSKRQLLQEDTRKTFFKNSLERGCLLRPLRFYNKVSTKDFCKNSLNVADC